MTLSARQLSKAFGGFLAVDSVSIEVGEGELVGLIGPNGAGKSTLFAVVSGFEPATSGLIRFAGRDITALPAARRARLGLGRTFQVPREFTHLTVRQNLMAAAPDQIGERVVNVFVRPGEVRRQEAGIQSKAEELLRFLKLERVAETAAGKLSGGQKKLLELGRVLMLEPKLVMLDEPFAGVNPLLVEDLSERIRELNRGGLEFLIVEHNLQALSALVSRLYVMDRGCIIAEGRPQAVLADARVREAYMGGVL